MEQIIHIDGRKFRKVPEGRSAFGIGSICGSTEDPICCAFFHANEETNCQAYYPTCSKERIYFEEVK